MTEAEWLAATKFDDAMSGTAIRSPGWSWREQTLFSVACCRRVIAFLDDERALQLLSEFESAELSLDYATGRAHHSRQLSDYVIEASGMEGCEALEVVFALGSASRGYISAVAEHCAMAVAWSVSGGAERPQRGDEGELQAQAIILRDIVGNPFRPITFAPEWRTSTAFAIAQGMYDSRDFGAMPILADALQDAGCDSDDVLKHCRDENATHVRGCWVADLVLGKA